MKLLSGFPLSNGYTLSITRAIGWSSFDVEISTADVIQRIRVQRAALTIMMQEFKRTGKLQIKAVELSVVDPVEKAHLLEQVEAVMREEII